jgi:hypothetical protein
MADWKGRKWERTWSTQDSSPEISWREIRKSLIQDSTTPIRLNSVGRIPTKQICSVKKIKPFGTEVAGNKIQAPLYEVPFFLVSRFSVATSRKVVGSSPDVVMGFVFQFT